MENIEKVVTDIGVDLTGLPERLTYEMIRVIPRLVEQILFEAAYTTDLRKFALKYRTTKEEIHLLIEEYRDSLPFYRNYISKKLAQEFRDHVSLISSTITRELIEEAPLRDRAACAKIFQETADLIEGKNTSNIVMKLELVNKEFKKLDEADKAGVLEVLRPAIEPPREGTV